MATRAIQATAVALGVTVVHVLSIVGTIWMSGREAFASQADKARLLALAEFESLWHVGIVLLVNAAPVVVALVVRRKVGKHERVPG